MIRLLRYTLYFTIWLVSCQVKYEEGLTAPAGDGRGERAPGAERGPDERRRRVMAGVSARLAQNVGLTNGADGRWPG
jgi:hypothetical protein